VTVATAIAVAGYVVLSAILIGIGLSLTKGLLSGPLGRWDESVNQWFFEHRTATLNAWSHVGSNIATTGTVIGIAAVVVIVLAIKHRWRDVGFLVIALTVEVTVFLTTTLVVSRPRPTVPHLEAAPPTSSFPSGHTAAAVVLYIGLAMLLSPHVHRTVLKVLLWIVAVSIPLAVAIARVYAGMHHPTDVFAGALLGLAALWVATMATRTAMVVAEDRKERRALEAASETPPSVGIGTAPPPTIQAPA
jgi:undecaprenyl-diphosphatase